MASYVSLKCDSCAGTLEYNKDKKVWVCKYCGAEIRREETYDGLYTIKNVVRQTLEDLAKGNMDAARRNLLECEKMDSRYVGTLIAGLSVKMFMLLTPGQIPAGEQRGMIDQIKRQYNALCAIDDGISSEEEALYEFLGGSGDSFGVLFWVYHQLGATSRRDFVENLLDLSEVFSGGLNTRLLDYAVKNNRMDMADSIFKNINHLDCTASLKTLLQDFPDGENKKNYLQSVFPKASVKADDYRRFDSYLTSSQDSANTKALVYTLAAGKGAAPSVRNLMTYVLSDPQLSEDSMTQTISAFCGTHPKDAQLYELLEAIYTKGKGTNALREMEILTDSDLFIRIPCKNVQFMLKRQELDVEERLALLGFAEQCKMEVRDNDTILTDFLLYDTENAQIRLQILTGILAHVDTISASALTGYILHSCQDGAVKPQILEQILALNLNMSFFRDVLDNYLKTDIDEPAVKNEICRLLSEKGFQTGCSTLVQMACSADASTAAETASFIQNALQKGTRMDAGALSTYLEATPGRCQDMLMALLYTPASPVSDQALANYVLYAASAHEVKLQNISALAGLNGKALGSTPCSIRVLGDSVSCNLLQAYVLLTPDAAITMETLVQQMKNNAKISASILANGNSCKFRDYVQNHRDALGQTSLDLCEECKLFSLSSRFFG